MSKTPTRPRDPNQLAKLIVDISTGSAQDSLKQASEDNPMASLGRAGGLKGGRARAESLTGERRAEIAKKAARVRWGEVREDSKNK